MASLLPLIQDLLPMILPSQIHITRARDLVPEQPGQEQPEPRLDLSVSSQEKQAADAAVRPFGSNGDLPAGAKQQQHQQQPPPKHGPEGVTGGGVLRRDAIVNKTDKLCASGPRSSSAVHHNSEHDTIIYAASGRGILATSPPDDDDDEASSAPRRDELGPGDFAFIPAWTEHQLVNDTDEQVVWVVVQGGPSPIVVNLTEWGGPEAKAGR